MEVWDTLAPSAILKIAKAPYLSATHASHWHRKHYGPSIPLSSKNFMAQYIDLHYNHPHSSKRTRMDLLFLADLAPSADKLTPPIDTSYFYSNYSTIAQALAGAFGFLAAVVLYRLQALN